MTKQLENKPLPKGIFRLLNRLPIFLYKCGLGFILGRRFLMLTHCGRKNNRSPIEVTR